MLVVVVALIVVIAIVVLVIILLGHKNSASTSSNTVPSTTAALPTVATVPATTAAPTTAVPAPTSTSLVSLANGVTSPAAASIQLSLAAYFNAINNHDWQAAWNQFTPAEKTAEPVAKLAQGASSSNDSGVLLTGFTPQGDGTVVTTVSFTSMQAAADSPDHQTCDRWTLNYVMAPSANGFLIGQSTPAANPPYQACPPAA